MSYNFWVVNMSVAVQSLCKLPIKVLIGKSEIIDESTDIGKKTGG